MSCISPVPVSSTALDRVELFSSLNSATRAEVAKSCAIVRYCAGKEILAQDEQAGAVYCVIAGRVRVTFFSPAGKELSFRDQFPGETFGELSAIDGGSRSARVVAVLDTTVLRISAERFQHLVYHHPEVAEKLIQRLTALVRSLTERVVEFSVLNVRSRVQSELLRMAGACGGELGQASIVDPPTHAEMAARISTHREAVTRELARLSRLGVLDRSRNNRWVVRDVSALRGMVRMVRMVLGN